MVVGNTEVDFFFFFKCQSLLTFAYKVCTFFLAIMTIINDHELALYIRIKFYHGWHSNCFMKYFVNLLWHFTLLHIYASLNGDRFIAPILFPWKRCQLNFRKLVWNMKSLWKQNYSHSFTRTIFVYTPPLQNFPVPSSALHKWLPLPPSTFTSFSGFRWKSLEIHLHDSICERGKKIAILTQVLLFHPLNQIITWPLVLVPG